jgi:hypothetical protein
MVPGSGHKEQNCKYCKLHEKGRAEETNTISESNHAQLLCSRAEYGTKVVKLSDWSVIKSGIGIPNDGASNQKKSLCNIVCGPRMYHFSPNNRV